MKTPIAILILVTFLLSSIIGPLPRAFADDFYLPGPGMMVPLSSALNPPMLKGIKIHPDNPFRFDFILDRGDSQLSNNGLKEESFKLIKYFLATLTIPEKDLWVNLSPYEKNRIIPQSFGLTEMGRDLLAEDYMLKQITASLIYPEDAIGKKFWKRIYEESAKRYGTTNIAVNTFNKVWIIPEKAVVYENAKAGTAYVVESRLKVMLEQDYLALNKNSSATSHNDVNALGSQIVREIIIPELTREVNENKNFAQLRQVYNSMILATWYKKKIKDSILDQVYADKDKTAGIQYTSSVIPLKAGIKFKNDVQGLYQEYLKAFKKGVYNYIKDEQDPLTQEVVPRKYFSGGCNFLGASLAMRTTTAWPAGIGNAINSLVEVDEDTASAPMAKPLLPKGIKAAIAAAHSDAAMNGVEIPDLITVGTKHYVLTTQRGTDNWGVDYIDLSQPQGEPNTLRVFFGFNDRASLERMRQVNSEMRRKIRGYTFAGVRVDLPEMGDIVEIQFEGHPVDFSRFAVTMGEGNNENLRSIYEVGNEHGQGDRLNAAASDFWNRIKTDTHISAVDPSSYAPSNFKVRTDEKGMVLILQTPLVSAKKKYEKEELVEHGFLLMAEGEITVPQYIVKNNFYPASRTFIHDFSTFYQGMIGTWEFYAETQKSPTPSEILIQTYLQKIGERIKRFIVFHDEKVSHSQLKIRDRWKIVDKDYVTEFYKFKNDIQMLLLAIGEIRVYGGHDLTGSSGELREFWNAIDVTEVFFREETVKSHFDMLAVINQEAKSLNLSSHGIFVQIMILENARRGKSSGEATATDKFIVYGDAHQLEVVIRNLLNNAGEAVLDPDNHLLPAKRWI